MKNENETPQINKDFTVTQQADAAQKNLEEQQRIERTHRLEDAKERLRIEKMIETREQEVKRAKQLEQAKLDKQAREETQKRIDAQRQPKLQHRIIKSITGQSPDMIADKVMAEMKVTHEAHMKGFEGGQRTTFNKVIDDQLDRAEARQRQSEQRVFEKEADRPNDSSKEAFQQAHDRKGGEKDWRSLMADRERDARNEPER